MRRNKVDGNGNHPWKAEVNEDDTSVAASWNNIFNSNSIMEDFFPKRETLLTIKNHEDKIENFL